MSSTKRRPNIAESPAGTAPNPRCTASFLLRDLSSLWHLPRLAGGGSHSWRLPIPPSVVFPGVFSSSDAKVCAFRTRIYFRI